MRECKFGDPSAESIINANLRILDLLVQRIQGQCANCRWPISVAREDNFQVYGLGPVCATCHAMHTAVNFNGLLRDPAYFRDLHEAWKIKRQYCGSHQLDLWYALARKTGAWGGKLCGAGGGGFLLFLAPPETHAAIVNVLGLRHVPIRVGVTGSEVVWPAR